MDALITAVLWVAGIGLGVVLFAGIGTVVWVLWECWKTKRHPEYVSPLLARGEES
ncbi:Uncharacterised protein [Mycobacteroides abscessus subsp. bolletii]|uniref:hypothetical protein n=1 Tax=Mycobacteroides abscessus TaxID=36809 RepID=UPI0009C75CA2|nr:hypothetical protein [Mycobacteroides abscessus]SLF32698.1 Uncharacterised protein [Mycobacteroides abscessus subsp. bolletii]